MKKATSKKITTEDLAGMTKRGFDEIGEIVKNGFNEMRQGFETINKNISILSENNTRDHEDIKLRLDNVAYRFELVELQKRVEVLEKKAGVKKGS